MDNSLKLSQQQLELLLPTLQDVAEHVKEHGYPEKDAWELLLIPGGLNEDWAATELDRWARLLARIRGTSNDQERDMAERGLRRCGIPQEYAVTAVETVAPRVAPNPGAVSSPLTQAAPAVRDDRYTSPHGPGIVENLGGQADAASSPGPTTREPAPAQGKHRKSRRPGDAPLIASGEVYSPQKGQSRGRSALSYLAMTVIVVAALSANILFFQKGQEKPPSPPSPPPLSPPLSPPPPPPSPISVILCTESRMPPAKYCETVITKKVAKGKKPTTVCRIALHQKNHCPKCHRVYDSATKWCPYDETALSQIRRVL